MQPHSTHQSMQFMIGKRVPNEPQVSSDLAAFESCLPFGARCDTSLWSLLQTPKKASRCSKNPEDCCFRFQFSSRPRQLLGCLAFLDMLLHRCLCVFEGASFTWAREIARTPPTLWAPHWKFCPIPVWMCFDFPMSPFHCNLTYSWQCRICMTSCSCFFLPRLCVFFVSTIILAV